MTMARRAGSAGTEVEARGVSHLLGQLGAFGGNGLVSGAGCDAEERCDQRERAGGVEAQARQLRREPLKADGGVGVGVEAAAILDQAAQRVKPVVGVKRRAVQLDASARPRSRDRR